MEAFESDLVVGRAQESPERRALGSEGFGRLPAQAASGGPKLGGDPLAVAWVGERLGRGDREPYTHLRIGIPWLERSIAPLPQGQDAREIRVEIEVRAERSDVRRARERAGS